MSLSKGAGDYVGRPPKTDHYSIVSTEISWYEPAAGDTERFILICPGCGERWSGEYPAPGVVYDHYREHRCDAPELPRNWGAPIAGQSKTDVIERIGWLLGWTEGVEYRKHGNTINIRKEGYRQILDELEVASGFIESLDN